MSILNVNRIQPVGSGQTVTINAANISAGSATLTAGTFSGNLNSTSGATTVAAGSTSAPSISPTGDSNTGIFFPSADTIALAEGGVESARFDSSGRLLIGTNTAIGGAKLQIYGNISDEPALMQFRYANNNPNSGTTIGQILFTDTNAANGQYATITCAADAGTGSADFPGRLVFATTADGSSNPTEHMRINNFGALKVNNSGSYNSATGTNHEISHNSLNDVLLTFSTNTSFTSTVYVAGCYRSATSSYKLATFYSGNGSNDPFFDAEFNLRGDGNAFADGSWTGGGADYAEYFEWSDGNPNQEDRCGISVVLEGKKIRPALDGEEPIGVISGNPSVVGDAAWNKWSGKYLRDDYGRYIQEDYEVINDEGETVIQQRRKLNPDYNSDQEYISREERPEWDTVGLVGKLRIRKGQPTGSRWIKMDDISDSVEEWLVR